MAGKKKVKDMRRLLSEYIKCLDKGQDRNDLMVALKKEKDTSEDYEYIYKEAALAQFLYYSRIAKERLPVMRQRFRELRSQVPFTSNK